VIALSRPLIAGDLGLGWAGGRARENHARKYARAGREENGKWQRKSLGKDGKTIMIICLE